MIEKKNQTSLKQFALVAVVTNHLEEKENKVFLSELEQSAAKCNVQLFELRAVSHSAVERDAASACTSTQSSPRL